MIIPCSYYIRPSGSAEVYFTETSMKDGFGLQYIHSFLNMPFLMLQVSKFNILVIC